ncbi:hypothetical protein ACH5RR_011685 [Cinchona calisaya]|uniref:Reverse transcriptase zinc-binding domain-containing protein n=1 Tax=Cinchona calisaya TaxID=153742 RepID=A0ABD3A733_9GENT
MRSGPMLFELNIWTSPPVSLPGSSALRKVQALLSSKLSTKKQTIQQWVNLESQNGLKARFWLDNWTSLGSIRYLVLGPLNLGEEFITISQVFGLGNSWNLSTLSLELPPNIVQKIIAIPRQVFDPGDDSIGWGCTIDTQFNIAEAHKMALSLDDQFKFSCVCKVKASSRVKYFLWLCSRNKLASKGLLLVGKLSQKMPVVSVLKMKRTPNTS